MEGLTSDQRSLVLPIIGIILLISFSSEKFYLIQIGDEDPGRPELKTAQPPKLSTASEDNLHSNQHGVDYNSTKSPVEEDNCTIENQCVCISDPDKKIAEMEFSSWNRNSVYPCCYRYWWRGQYCCRWSKLYCGWFGKK